MTTYGIGLYVTSGSHMVGLVTDYTYLSREPEVESEADPEAGSDSPLVVDGYYPYQYLRFLRSSSGLEYSYFVGNTDETIRFRTKALLGSAAGRVAPLNSSQGASSSVRYSYAALDASIGYSWVGRWPWIHSSVDFGTRQGIYQSQWPQTVETFDKDGNALSVDLPKQTFARAAAYYLSFAWYFGMF